MRDSTPGYVEFHHVKSLYVNLRVSSSATLGTEEDDPCSIVVVRSTVASVPAN